MQLFTKWAKSDRKLGLRVIVVLLAGGLFVALIPYALLRWLPGLDHLLGFPAFNLGLPGSIAGFILVLGGLPIAFWTVLDQIIRAHGTPVPLLPTQRLLTDGPYSWTRNPMVFGTLCAYLGLSLLARSWSALGVTLLFGMLLLSYLKLVEERELEARFGSPYRDYKKRVSFLIPWPPERRDGAKQK